MVETPVMPKAPAPKKGRTKKEAAQNPVGSAPSGSPVTAEVVTDGAQNGILLDHSFVLENPETTATIGEGVDPEGSPNEEQTFLTHVSAPERPSGSDVHGTLPLVDIVRAVVKPLARGDCPTLVKHRSANRQVAWTLVKATGPSLESAWAACRAVDPGVGPEAFLAMVGSVVGAVPEAYRVVSLLNLD